MTVRELRELLFKVENQDAEVKIEILNLDKDMAIDFDQPIIRELINKNGVVVIGINM